MKTLPFMSFSDLTDGLDSVTTNTTTAPLPSEVLLPGTWGHGSQVMRVDLWGCLGRGSKGSHIYHVMLSFLNGSEYI